MKILILALTLSWNFLFVSAFVSADHMVQKAASHREKPQKGIQQYLLPDDHILQKTLKNIFRNPKMFNNRKELKRSGFELSEHYNRGLIVASHPEAPEYMFKKFINAISNGKQLQNYIARIKGANAIRKLIDSQQLNSIVVPKKWLYQLPKKFSNKQTGESSYILIVERIDIYNEKQSRRKFSEEIPKNILKELTTVLYKYPGLDSSMDNMTFTKSNQIAFIDTSKWNYSGTIFLKVARRYMRAEDIQYAHKCYLKLRKENRPIKKAFF